MDLAIRRAAAADADSASDLYVRACRAAAEAGSVPPATHSDAGVAESIRHVVIPKLECWLAETPRGDIVGILVLGGGRNEERAPDIQYAWNTSLPAG